MIARSGLSASWDAQKRLIRLNLRRGGAFVFKAVAVTQELYKSGVKDAELAYSYGIAFLRQGNEGGSLRFFREAISLDPTFVSSYEVLNAQGQLSDDNLTLLQKVRPDIALTGSN
jgi:Flp pilus assembly protein TadD